jgi:hypothetical protein
MRTLNHANIESDGTAKYAKYAKPNLLWGKGSGFFAYFAYFAVQEIAWAGIWAPIVMLQTSNREVILAMYIIVAAGSGQTRFCFPKYTRDS